MAARRTRPPPPWPPPPHCRSRDPSPQCSGCRPPPRRPRWGGWRGLTAGETARERRRSAAVPSSSACRHNAVAYGKFPPDLADDCRRPLDPVYQRRTRLQHKSGLGLKNPADVYPDSIAGRLTPCSNHQGSCVRRVCDVESKPSFPIHTCQRRAQAFVGRPVGQRLSAHGSLLLALQLQVLHSKASFCL
jgi:hypothetical protein